MSSNILLLSNESTEDTKMTTWIDSINNGATIAIVYGILLFLPSLAGSILLRGGRFNVAKYSLNMLFFGYMCCVFSLVFLPLPTMGTQLSGHQIQLIPGYALYDIAKNPSMRAVAQVLFNIVMTMPFGGYLKYYWKMDMKKITILSFALTLFIEVGQLTGLFFIYSGSYRLCDVDDLICNTLGGVLGAWMATKCVFLPKLEKFDRVVFAPMRKHA